MELSEAARAAGFSLRVLGVVDSTNRLALEAAAEGGAGRTWFVAREQINGRGRHGRQWASPPGNLYATLLLIDPCPVAMSPRLGFVAGVAIAEAVRDTAPGMCARLKWPNDLMADGCKLTGILLEGRSLGAGQAVAIGIGANVEHAPEIAGRRSACLHGLGHSVSVAELFVALADAMARRLVDFRGGAGFAAIRAAWLHHAMPSGTPMSVKLHDRVLAGAFAGLDADGRLALDTPEGLVHVDAGDVFLANERDGGSSNNGR